jgi:hypothetical protein
MAFIDRNRAAEQDATASAYFAPRSSANSRFQQGHGRVLGRRVAEKIACFQQAVYLGPCGLRDGFGVVGVRCGSWCAAHLFDFPKVIFGKIVHHVP